MSIQSQDCWSLYTRADTTSSKRLHGERSLNDTMDHEIAAAVSPFTFKTHNSQTATNLGENAMKLWIVNVAFRMVGQCWHRTCHTPFEVPVFQ